MNNFPGMPWGFIEFLCQLLERQAIEKPGLEHLAASFGIIADDPLINQQFKLRPSKINQAHFFLTLPVP